MNGQFSGVGAFYYLDGSVFIGNWKDNKKHGEGKMHFISGEKIHGNWFKDELQNQIDISQCAEKKEEGDQLSSKIEAQEEDILEQEYWKDCSNSYCHREIGQMTYQDGSYWQGSFTNGQPDGFGTMFYAGGNRYEGQLSSHAPNGEGLMYFANGQIIGGTWKEGYLTKEKPYNLVKQGAKLANKINQSGEVKIWAVIVGVASYSHMPSLRFTDDDAYPTSISNYFISYP